MTDRAPSAPPSVTVVVPVYDEAECITEIITRLDGVASKRPDLSWSFLFVNDGSSDGSREILDEAGRADPRVKVVHLARNFGHQAAVTAGMDLSTATYTAILDADLQDPPEVLLAMLEKLEQGFNLAYGRRTHRARETFLKRHTARLFYRTLSRVTQVSIPEDAGDFRMFDTKVLAAVKRLPEYHRFLRGMIAWVGFRATAVEYARDGRYAGATKYSWFKMVRLAFDAISSFSDVPLRTTNYFGLLTSFVGSLGLLYVIYKLVVDAEYIPGTSATLFAVLFMGGVQLISLGVIGQYIGRIFEQSKQRPLYIVDETVNVREEQ